jgi:hypothetical protein
MFQQGTLAPTRWWQCHLTMPAQTFNEFSHSLKWAHSSEESGIDCRFDPVTEFPEFLETDSSRLSDSYFGS